MVSKAKSYFGISRFRIECANQLVQIHRVLSMKKAIALAVSAISLVACSSMPMATKIAPEQSTGFFSAGKDAKSGTVYFTCGRHTYSSWLVSTKSELGGCQYSVNSVAYKGIEKGSIGRLDLTAGTYEIKQVDQPLATIVPLKLEVRAGEVVLVKAHYDMKAGVLGGAINASHVFTVDYDKEDVLEKVKDKQPVLMEPAPEAK